jgi:hypothetical protein
MPYDKSSRSQYRERREQEAPIDHGAVTAPYLDHERDDHENQPVTDQDSVSRVRSTYARRPKKAVRPSRGTSAFSECLSRPGPDLTALRVHNMA